MQDNDIITNKERIKILAILTGAYFFSGFAALCFAPLLPFIQDDLSLNKAGLGLFISSLYIGSIAAGIPTGRLADRWGVPKTISLGLLVLGLSLGIICFIPFFSLIIFFVFIAGLGFGAINPATSKGVIVWFTAQWRATAMAIKQMGFTAGTMVTAIILPVVAEALGWRWSIFIVSILVILYAAISICIYPASIQKVVKKLKVSQAGIREEKPAWKNKQIILWSILCIFYAIVQFSGTAYMAIYMVDYFSFTKVMAGIFLGITQGGGALGRVLWGRISDLFFSEQRDKEIIAIGFIAALMCILLGVISPETHYIIVGIIAAIFGFTAIGYNALFMTLIGEIAGPEKAGQASGFAVTIAYCGVVIGPPLFGLAVDHFGYNISWTGLGGMLIMALIIAMILMKKINLRD